MLTHLHTARHQRRGGDEPKDLPEYTRAPQRVTRTTRTTRMTIRVLLAYTSAKGPRPMRDRAVSMQRLFTVHISPIKELILCCGVRGRAWGKAWARARAYGRGLGAGRWWRASTLTVLSRPHDLGIKVGGQRAAVKSGNLRKSSKSGGQSWLKKFI